LAYRRSSGLKGKFQKFATVQVGQVELSVASIPDSLRKIEVLAPLIFKKFQSNFYRTK
jgi:hypothetical protein